MGQLETVRPVDLVIIEKEIADLKAAYPELGEDEQLCADMIEGSTNLTKLLELLLSTYQEAGAMRLAIASRIKDLDEREHRYARRQEGAKKMMLRLMDIAGLKKLPLTEATLSVARVAPSVQVVDEAGVPDQFWRVKETRSIDKAALKEALQNGVTIAGAYMNNGSQTLRVL